MEEKIALYQTGTESKTIFDRALNYLKSKYFLRYNTISLEFEIRISTVENWTNLNLNSLYIELIQAGIDIPIIPGIKPIATLNHLQLLPQVFKIDLPEALINEVLKCKTNNDVREVGIEWAINQSKELLDFGIPVLHFYSMGKSDNIKKIAGELF